MTNNSQLTTSNKNRNSFTLIELLVVLALVAILSVVVILTLNPAELIKQARDSNRLSDLSTINTALNLFSADVTSGFMGTSTVVYVSLPDNASSTCGSLGLPALPTGYTYSCATSANLRKTDGTGWIPVNFQRISSNSPISQLPIDPINTTTTNSYYTYMTGGSFELTANMEARKNMSGGSDDKVTTAGSSNYGRYSTGSAPGLYPIKAPFINSLKNWFAVDFISGLSDGQVISSWSDTGSAAANAVQVNGSLQPLYKTNQINGYSVVRFDGIDDYLRTTSYSLPQPFSIFMVLKRLSFNNYSFFVEVGGGNTAGLQADGSASSQLVYAGANVGAAADISNATVLGGAFNSVNSISYINGVTASGNAGTNYGAASGLTIGRSGPGGSSLYSNIDVAEILVYSYALSQDEQRIVGRYLGQKYGIVVP